MKRYNNLLTEDTVTLEFCERAITEAARGKKKREKVAHILKNKDIYAHKIQYMLLNDTFVPHAYGGRNKNGKRQGKTSTKTYLLSRWSNTSCNNNAGKG